MVDPASAGRSDCTVVDGTTLITLVFILQVEYVDKGYSFNWRRELMIDFLINISGGLIQTRKQASYVLLTISIVLIIITVLILSGGREIEQKEPPSPMPIPKDDPAKLYLPTQP